MIPKDVFHLTRQTFDEYFPNDQNLRAIFKIILTPIVGRIGETRNQNHKILVKSYTVHSDNNSSIARQCEAAANIDFERVEEPLLVEGSEETFRLTTV